jgi:hypothetical protein
MTYEELINSIPKEPLDGFIATLPPPPTPRHLPAFEPSGDESSQEDPDFENASDLQQDDE